ncbi:MAG: hypothetical protein M1812_001996 [Candelaria pacifica]|nr:MAG: hypothetical protein M1812_001996 [Candelaria pacifica]
MTIYFAPVAATLGRPPKLAPPLPFRPRPASRSGNSSSLLRYLFPHTRQRARTRLSKFKHETLPYYRLRAQSRIYRFLIERQSRHQRNKLAGKGVLNLLRRRSGRLFGGRLVKNVASKQRKMTQPGTPGQLSRNDSYGGGNLLASEGHERGGRRRKLAGYLKAANELRQSYQQSYSSQWGNSAEADEDDAGIPGAFSDVAVVRNEGEEMVLFPSYARRHVKREKPQVTTGSQQHVPGSADDNRDASGTGDAEYWRKEWEKYEDDNAIVDVDVRGWLYAPHRGPMTRKNRLMMGIARRLSGIPAPPENGFTDDSGNAPHSRASSIVSTHREKMDARKTRHEEEQAAKQAESIMRKGEGEADIAGRGGYSEEPTRNPSIYSADSRSNSPKPDQTHHPLSNTSLAPETGHVSEQSSSKRQITWSQPSDMTPAELSVANSHLMLRLKPFLTNPLMETPVTVFFYNDKTSQSRSIVTNEAGHFSVRAALDFVPTHVRVLASENLSATEEVQITEPSGVSLISDIDDTIKHSAIGNGAKEIFRNTFIRDLGDLSIEGVNHWYKKLADMGVKMHYVSNSPWQLYPLLVSFFAMAGLPQGSFHLKQYSGMLQGIFEPVAERKKTTLEKIMRDFPERRFLLVGDSGEADLEVYTDVVLANPGRILGVFIRDVTTPVTHGFFDSSMGPLSGERNSRQGSTSSSRSNMAAREAKIGPAMEQRPSLPPRRPTEPVTSQERNSGPALGKLIDFDDEEPAIDNAKSAASSPALSRSKTDARLQSSESSGSTISPGELRSMKSPPPARPSKPPRLRSSSSSDAIPPASTSTRKAPPEIPPKPREYSISSAHPPSQPPEPRPLTKSHTGSSMKSTSSADRAQGYRSSIRNKVSFAYNSLPSASAYWYGQPTNNPQSQNHLDTSRSPGEARAMSFSPTREQKREPPPVPLRRNLTSYPAAAAQYASNRLSSNWSSAGGGEGEDANGMQPNAPVNKKEEMWKRRWARAKGILESKGVVLRSWRVGSDAVGDCVRLVDRAQREIETKNGSGE